MLLALAAKTDDPQRHRLIVDLMAQRDPVEAAKMVSEMAARPDAAQTTWFSQPDAAHFVCLGLTRIDPLKAAEWADSLPVAVRTEALAEVASLWSASDPVAAMTWLAAHPATKPGYLGYPPRQVGDMRTEALAAWLKRDEDGARAWLAARPADDASRDYAGQLVSHLMTTGRTAEAAAKFGNLDASERGPLAGEIAGKWAANDPQSAAAWAVQLPEGRAQQAAIAGAVRGWAERDPAAAAAWIEEFPAGLPRDRAVDSLAQTIARKDPSAAAEWVGEIADPWRRNLAAEAVFWNWHYRDRSAAVEWLIALTGIDETIRRQLLEDSEQQR
ncbi:MAG: hypothetical protein ABI680_20170 [Chthoniobacteraceae bacterium]